MSLPTLETDRLILRPLAALDSARVKELAGVREVYETTLNIPHPYEDGMAEEWIATHEDDFVRGNGITLGILLKDSDLLIGAIGLRAIPVHKRAELGYWIGLPYWRQGYCTEASRAVIRYGFETSGYHKIAAFHLESNSASGRVMEKAGMKREGKLVDHVLKDGKFYTVLTYGITRKDGAP